MRRSAAHRVLDTSVLVSYFRTGKYRAFLLSGLEQGTVLLLEESTLPLPDRSP